MAETKVQKSRLSDSQALGLLIAYLVFRIVSNRIGIAYLPRMLDEAPWAVPLLNNSQIILIAVGTGVRDSLSMQIATGATAILQALVAGSVLYWAGHRFGETLAERSAKTGSMWAALWNPRQIAKAHRWLDRRGWWAIIVARTIEWLVTPVVLVAGAGRMQLRRFYASYFIGSICFVTVTLGAGAMAGEQWPWLPEKIKSLSEWSLRIALGLLVLAVLAMAVAGRLEKKDQDEETTTPSQGSSETPPATTSPS